MIKFLLLGLFIYLLYRMVRGFFQGIVIVTQIKRDQNSGEGFAFRSPRTAEKDISSKARVLDEDKKIEE